MKQYNKIYKKAEKWAKASNEKTPAEFLKLGFEEAGLGEVTIETCHKFIAVIDNAYSWEKQPYPGWEITNLGGTIRQVKKRIDTLTAHADDETTESMINGVRVIDNVEEHRLQLLFDGKPDENIRKMLKASGFRWTPSKECWQSYRGTHQNHRAEMICKEMPVHVSCQ
jgi:hypothetical protein